MRFYRSKKRGTRVAAPAKKRLTLGERIRNYFRNIRAMGKGKKALAIVGLLLCVAQLGVSVFAGVMVFRMGILAAWQFALVVLVLLVLLLGVTWWQQYFVRGLIAKVVCLLLCAALGYGCYMAYLGDKTLGGITDETEQKTIVAVMVKKDDPAEELADIKGYPIGALSKLDHTNTKVVLNEIDKATDDSNTTKDYETTTELASALMNGDVKAIILNTSYLSAIEGIEEYENFEDETKIIYQKEFVTKVDTNAANVTKEPFVVYLSGIDTYGDISLTSRSDVNILAIVNPQTKQILLVNTPRDYFVPLSISGGVRDKLTHAGLYGIDCSMDTLGMLYDVEVNYYLRVNFSGFSDIINAVGGIDVNSAYDFYALNGMHYTKGTNHLSGEEALMFARERKAFSNGDNQRGKNQMEVIRALVQKCASAEFLKNFTSLMNSIDGCFQTNMTSKEIYSLVNMQLSDLAQWDVKTYAVSGSSAYSTCYSLSQAVSVMVPYESDIEDASKLIDLMMSGEFITESDIPESSKVLANVTLSGQGHSSPSSSASEQTSPEEEEEEVQTQKPAEKPSQKPDTSGETTTPGTGNSGSSGTGQGGNTGNTGSTGGTGSGEETGGSGEGSQSGGESNQGGTTTPPESGESVPAA